MADGWGQVVIGKGEWWEVLSLEDVGRDEAKGEVTLKGRFIFGLKAESTMWASGEHFGGQGDWREGN